MNASSESETEHLKSNSSYQAPQHPCDLIMKGGVTSGVVYPRAILELAVKYRFRSVGGTSAGAIAAAAAAAAEFGREVESTDSDKREQAGFAGLYDMMKELEKPRFLLHLFQPAPEARPLFDRLLELKKFLDQRKKDRQQALSERERGLPARPRRLRQTRELLKLAWNLTKDSGSSSGPSSSKKKRTVVPLVAWSALSTVRGAPRPVRLAAVLGSLRAGRRLTSSLRNIKGSIDYLLNKDQSYFALCTGMPADPTRSHDPVLTEWLHERIQQLAGLGREPNDVLTFGRLRAKQLPGTGGNGDVGIYFQLVTTNLSHRQPYILRGEDPKQASVRKFNPEELETTYLFKESDMIRLFPKEVVEYLKTWTTHPDHEAQWTKENPFKGIGWPEGYHPFPWGNALPVVVATRMSLSFPILLSAVRLYTVKRDILNVKPGPAAPCRTLKAYDPTKKPKDNDLEENWFSDGGIASNFPIHIFDAWIPSRPTFGISLADCMLPPALDVPRKTPYPRGEEDVNLPSPSELQFPEAFPIPHLGSFLGAIFDTAQNYRDNTQARMPSYRERIAQVLLKENEGGLNLDMPPKVITALGDKGRLAAEKFLTKFDWAEHRWVRLLVLQARLEREFDLLREDYEMEAEKNGLPRSQWSDCMYRQYAALLKQQLEQQKKDKDKTWYKSHDEEWCKEAQRRMRLLIRLMARWDACQVKWQQRSKQKRFFSFDEPVPKGILRVTPLN